MSRPSSVPLLPAREGEVLRRCDATLPVGFPRSDAVFAAGAAVGSCNMPTLLSSNHHDGMDSTEGTTDIATGPEVLSGAVVCLTNTFQEGDPLLSPTKKWLDSHGQLVRPEGGWSTTLSAHIPASRASHSKLSKGCKTKCGYRPPVQKIERAFARGNVITTSTFSMLSDASVSITSYSQPRARVLHPYISKFYLVYYEIKEDISLERSTFFVDRNGQIFMFRSFRAQWLMDHVEEVEVTHDILRQSSKRPHLTSWHVKHQARVDAFMAQPIVKRIINWISDVVEIVFPGIAHQFKQDAKWHEECYGIKPFFGLFWNLCFNAWFHDQRSIHCGPHADKKNQVGICLLLIYILKCGTNVACHLGGWSRCAPESNDAPEPPDVNALLPTVFNLLHQLGVNPSGLLSAEVIKLQKQISLNATSHVAEPVAEAINGNQPRQMSLTKPCEILWSSENLEPRRIHNGRRKEVDSYIAALVANKPMAGYVEICGY
ncbi:hypothetical protein B0H17DRAFT_1149285 [Mycena rosella]|uniref:Uncharacterized protein n=1 Tax=Mycena rosella TaxID=1033263 RepID=A0AAD7C3B1_MYCRO|nr:hypothetical protein B0H17DRAFT_1149285 [Mycena rosella]